MGGSSILGEASGDEEADEDMLGSVFLRGARGGGILDEAEAAAAAEDQSALAG